MKFFLLFLLFPISSIAQKIEVVKTDSFLVNTQNYLTYELKIKAYSASDQAKVFVTAVENFDSLSRLIPKYYILRKQEYNEYYILGVPNLKNKKDVDKALMVFLNRIDSARELRQRSTFRKVYTWDNIAFKINYQNNYKELSQIDDLFYLKSLNDICKYMICPYVQLKKRKY